jgi:hypothetical protein
VGNKTNGEHKGKSKKIKINFFNFLKQICIWWNICTDYWHLCVALRYPTLNSVQRVWYHRYIWRYFHVESIFRTV